MLRFSREKEQWRVPPFDSFFNFLRNSNPLEKDYNDFQNLVNSGLTTEQALAKLQDQRGKRLLSLRLLRFSREKEQWNAPPFHSFFNFLRNGNPLEKDYNDFQNLVNSGLTTEQALAKLQDQRGKGLLSLRLLRFSREKEQWNAPPFHSFFNFLRNSNPLEKDYNDFQNLVNSGLTTEQALAKLQDQRDKRLLSLRLLRFSKEKEQWNAPPFHSFFNFLRNSNPLEKDYNDFQNLVNSGLTTEQALAKSRMDRIPPTVTENYSYLQSIWENNNMQYFSDFFKWYNKTDVVPTLEAMQKMIDFCHNKGIDFVKLGCTLPNLANICLHKSTDSEFYPFTEWDRNLLEKIREDMVGGPPVVFTRKAVVDETFIRKSSNLCKSIVGIDASQLYPNSMCQPMHSGLCTQWEYDSETKRFTARQNKSHSAEIMVRSYFQQSWPDCKIESNVTTGRQKKNDCFTVEGICYHCNTVFEAMGCYYHCCPYQEARASLRDTDIERGVKKRQQDEMRREDIQQKV